MDLNVEMALLAPQKVPLVLCVLHQSHEIVNLLMDILVSTGKI